MKDFMICVLAIAWVLEVIWLQRIRRHPYERPDHIDRDFRDMVDRLCGREDTRIRASFKEETDGPR